MRQVPDLKTIEKQAYMTYHADGLLDICVGGVFFAMGLLLITELEGLIGLTGFLPLFYLACKRRFTYPRMGYVRLANPRGGRRGSVYVPLILLAVFALITSVLMYRWGGSPFSGGHPWQLLALGVFLGQVGILVAMTLRIIRFYIYAVLGISAFAVGVMFGGLPYLIAGWGAVMVATGAALLVRFLSRYAEVGNGIVG